MVRQIELKLTPIFYPLLEHHRLTILFGGRAGGKSDAVAELLAIEGYIEPLTILCARELQNSLADSSKALIERKIREKGLSFFYNITENEIIGRNGTRFIFKGLKINVGSLQSLDAIDVLWIEEGQDCSAQSWTSIEPTIRKKGSRIIISMNPKRAKDVIYEDFVKDFVERGYTPPRSKIIKVNYTDNPYIAETELLSTIERDKLRNPARFRHIWLGELETRDDVLVFSNWETKEIDIPDELEAVALFGADWGFAVDPTVLIKCFILEDKTLYVAAEAYGHKVETDQIPMLFDRIPGSRTSLIWADNARPEIIRSLQRLNYRIRPVDKGKNSVIEGVGFIQNLDVVIHPKCTHTISEFEKYSYDVDRNGVILPNIVPKNDHCIDALRYAVRGVSRNIRVSSYTFSTESGTSRALLPQSARVDLRNEVGAAVSHAHRRTAEINDRHEQLRRTHKFLDDFVRARLE